MSMLPNLIILGLYFISELCNFTTPTNSAYGEIIVKNSINYLKIFADCSILHLYSEIVSLKYEKKMFHFRLLKKNTSSVECLACKRK